MQITRVDEYTAFRAYRRIASGSLFDVGEVVKRAWREAKTESVVIIDNATGRSIDIDLSEPAVPVTPGESKPALIGVQSDGRRLRGRPKLGVVAREVTLLPRHWEWLNSQPGGASVALRKLVDEARRMHRDDDCKRKAQERAFNFMSAIAGDLPNYEEATRALFASDEPRLRELMMGWTEDVREHAMALALNDGRPDEIGFPSSPAPSL